MRSSWVVRRHRRLLSAQYWARLLKKILGQYQYHPIPASIGQYPIPQCWYRSNPNRQSYCDKSSVSHLAFQVHVKSPVSHIFHQSVIFLYVTPGTSGDSQVTPVLSPHFTHWHFPARHLLWKEFHIGTAPPKVEQKCVLSVNSNGRIVGKTALTCSRSPSLSEELKDFRIYHPVTEHCLVHSKTCLRHTANNVMF